VSEDRNWALLAKCPTDECTPSERQEVSAWLAADARNQQAFERSTQLWQRLPTDHSQARPISAALWQRLQANLHRETQLLRAVPVAVRHLFV